MTTVPESPDNLQEMKDLIDDALSAIPGQLVIDADGQFYTMNGNPVSNYVVLIGHTKLLKSMRRIKAYSHTLINK